MLLARPHAPRFDTRSPLATGHPADLPVTPGSRLRLASAGKEAEYLLPGGKSFAARVTEFRGPRLLPTPGPASRGQSPSPARAELFRLLGHAAVHGGAIDPAESARRYAEALALAEPRHMRPLIAHCHAGLAKLCHRTGKPDQEHEHLAKATTMYGEMGMTYWLERMNAEMRELA